MLLSQNPIFIHDFTFLQRFQYHYYIYEFSSGGEGEMGEDAEPLSLGKHAQIYMCMGVGVVTNK